MVFVSVEVRHAHQEGSGFPVAGSGGFLHHQIQAEGQVGKGRVAVSVDGHGIGGDGSQLPFQLRQPPRQIRGLDVAEFGNVRLNFFHGDEAVVAVVLRHVAHLVQGKRAAADGFSLVGHGDGDAAMAVPALIRNRVGGGGQGQSKQEKQRQQAGNNMLSHEKTSYFFLRLGSSRRINRISSMGIATTGATSIGSNWTASAVIRTVLTSSILSMRCPRTSSRWVLMP